MRRWERLDAEQLAGGGLMELLRGGEEYLIQVDGIPLMGTRDHRSEDALADLGTERVRGADARILVGGLGMGFTAARALQRLGPSARVVVAELASAVVRWNRGPAGAAAGHVLDDPRVELHAGDVAEVIRSSSGSLDAILLDVDNGPEALSHAGNGWLYGAKGLASCRRALRSGGVLGVWSVAPDDRFTDRLRRAGFEVTVHRTGARGKGHVVWLGAVG